MSKPLSIECAVLSDRYVCATAALAFAIRAGLAREAAVQVSIAAAELASNAVRHAGGGVLELATVEVPAPAVELVCRDRGPGIADVRAALRDGHSRGRDLGPDDVRRDGLGSGLGAVARAMDELSIESSERGTIVRARKLIRGSTSRGGGRSPA